MRDDPLLDLVLVLVPFSLLSVGGGPSIFAPLQHQAVEVMGWLPPREFIDMFAIARAAPGPGSMLATLIGWKVAGWSGAVVATLALFAPSSLLAYGVAHFYDRYRGHAWRDALETGLAPIAVGLIAAGSIAVLHLSGDGWLNWALALGAGAVMSWRPKLHPFVVLAAGGLIAVAAEFLA